MSQEVIRDFLNVPGIAGIALIYGRSQPFFYGIDPAFELCQKEALSQGILQVVETIPEGFESFEFRFSEYQISLNRLESNTVLLVVRRGITSDESYPSRLDALQAFIRVDTKGAIATLQEMCTELPVPEDADLPDLPVPDLPLPSPPSSLPAPPTLQDLLYAINHLSEFTTQYLGTAVIVNYWKSTRPEVEWLGKFQIDRTAQMSFLGESSKIEQPISNQEHQWVRDWIAAFIHRCSQVVRDFARLVEQNALTDAQKALLLN